MTKLTKNIFKDCAQWLLLTEGLGQKNLKLEKCKKGKENWKNLRYVGKTQV
jgi:hypothetical protein